MHNATPIAFSRRGWRIRTGSLLYESRLTRGESKGGNAYLFKKRLIAFGFLAVFESNEYAAGT